MFKGRMTIGKLTIEAEGSDLRDIFKFAGTFGGIPQKCNQCKSPNLNLSHRKAKDFDFYLMKCADCGAEGTFGQAKVGGGMYWKKDTLLEVYKGEA